jgi:hypothetical protein
MNTNGKITVRLERAAAAGRTLNLIVRDADNEEWIVGRLHVDLWVKDEVVERIVREWGAQDDK